MLRFRESHERGTRLGRPLHPVLRISGRGRGAPRRTGSLFDARSRVSETRHPGRDAAYVRDAETAGGAIGKTPRCRPKACLMRHCPPGSRPNGMTRGGLGIREARPRRLTAIPSETPLGPKTNYLTRKGTAGINSLLIITGRVIPIPRSRPVAPSFARWGFFFCKLSLAGNRARWPPLPSGRS
jgi:hypothetical protein